MTTGILFVTTKNSNLVWIDASSNCEIAENMVQYFSSNTPETCYILDCEDCEYAARKMYMTIADKYSKYRVRSNWYEFPDCINIGNILNEYYEQIQVIIHELHRRLYKKHERTDEDPQTLPDSKRIKTTE